MILRKSLWLFSLYRWGKWEMGRVSNVVMIQARKYQNCNSNQATLLPVCTHDCAVPRLMGRCRVLCFLSTSLIQVEMYSSLRPVPSCCGWVTECLCSPLGQPRILAFLVSERVQFHPLELGKNWADWVFGDIFCFTSFSRAEFCTFKSMSDPQTTSAWVF